VPASAITADLISACEQFLYREAEMLDDGRLHDWLSLLDNDIDYRIPTRVTREHGALKSGFSSESFLMIDDLGSLIARVRRFDTGFAFAEDPPTRTRRIIGNVRVAGHDNDDDLVVKSNFILFRTKFDHESQLLAGERHDVLRRAGETFFLKSRAVLLEHTVLPMENLAIFL
jgi:3-phenylpropionate/cinnamic acid dioxygenase small subunit